MFEENHEVVQEKPKKVKKQMSEERKAMLREQLRKAREKKKANKEAREAKAKGKQTEQPEPVKMEIIEQPPLSTRKEKNKNTNKIALSPIKEEIEPTDNSKEIIAKLKEEIAELKKGKTSSSDMDEIRALKEEMKEIRDATKAYKAHQKKLKEQAQAKPKVEKAKVEKQVVIQEPVQVNQPVKRYSTYKKSIWADLL